MSVTNGYKSFHNLHTKRTVKSIISDFCVYHMAFIIKLSETGFDFYFQTYMVTDMTLVTYQTSAVFSSLFSISLFASSTHNFDSILTKFSGSYVHHLILKLSTKIYMLNYSFFCQWIPNNITKRTGHFHFCFYLLRGTPRRHHPQLHKAQNFLTKPAQLQSYMAILLSDVYQKFISALLLSTVLLPVNQTP